MCEGLFNRISVLITRGRAPRDVCAQRKGHVRAQREGGVREEKLFFYPLRFSNWGPTN